MEDREDCDLGDIPPFLDRRPNGRCRAYWMAHERAPGNKNPHEWAIQKFGLYLDSAAVLDERNGLCPGCQFPSPGHDGNAPTLKPIRTRTRAA